MSQIFQNIIDSNEFREEFFVAGIQAQLANLLDEKGISRAELARKLDVSRARVTQIFSDDATNFTIRLLYRSFLALDEELVILTKSKCDEMQRAAEGRTTSSRPAKMPQDEAGIPSALIGELLRMSGLSENSHNERQSKRPEGAQQWAEVGSNVVPLKGVANG